VETEPFWLSSVYAEGQSGTGVKYTRIIWDSTEDLPGEEQGFLDRLAEAAQLDSGKLQLICSSRQFDLSEADDSDSVMLSYRDQPSEE